MQATNQQEIPLHYTKLTHQLSLKRINLKVDLHKAGEMVHPRLKTPQGESISKPGLFLIQHVNILKKGSMMSNPFFEIKILVTERS